MASSEWSVAQKFEVISGAWHAIMKLILQHLRFIIVTVCRLPFTNHRSPITVHYSPVPVHRFLLTISFLLLTLYCLPLTSLAAGDEPFVGAANGGETGLMETPTARVMREGRYRIGAGQVDPYRYYYAVVSPFEGVEVGGKVTEVLDSAVSPDDPNWQGYGNYKDKSIDFKYQFLSEGKWWPALALGIMDPHGTRVYPSQYLVASKQIYPFDFTVGFGNGRYGKRPLASVGEGFKAEMFTDNASWRNDGQFFAGVQFALSERLMLMAEYNPIQYENQTTDPAQAKYFTEPVRSKFNYGLRWRPLDWLETDLSYQRGEQIGVNVSMAFDLGVPLIPIYDRPYKEKPEYRLHPWEDRIARGLDESGFSNIVMRLNGDELAIEAQNDKYYYTPRAIEVMLRVVAEIAPADVRTLRLIIARGGIPVVSFTCLREDAVLFLEEKITEREFLALNSALSWDTIPNSANLGHVHEKDHVPQTGVWEGLPGEKLYREWWSYGIKPSFRMFLNDPSGFFKYRLGARGWLSFNPWQGASLVTGLELYPLNNVSTVNAPPSMAVRSDIVPYLENKAVLSMLMAEQIKKFPREIYGRLSAGILEIQYAGLDWEAARPFFGGRLMVGLSGSLVKKRDPDVVFGFKDNDFKDTYKTAFVNTRLNFPEVETSIDFKAGQFLAGDKGTVITVTKFFNGLYLSAWYSITDTDNFTDTYNRGYHDKGIAISLPLRFFKGTDSKTSYNFGLSPWTRDVAQDIDHFTTLFDYMGRNVPIYLKKDWIK